MEKVQGNDVPVTEWVTSSRLQLIPITTHAVILDGKDNDGNAIENKQDSEQTTNIHIENSSDVIIGPVTQFHGPVTIVNKSPSIQLDKTSNGTISKNDKAKEANENGSSVPYKRILLLRVIVGLVIVFFILTVALSGYYFNATDNLTEVQNNDTAKLGTHRIVTRKLWGGRPPLKIRKLAHPVDFVIISHTAATFCKTPSRCAEQVQGIQSYHVSNFGSPDIGYNFLIGGDDNIYEGRGWDAINFHDDKCIGICFMGNFVYDELTVGMIEAVKLLLKQGVELKKLSSNYSVVSHNQTFATDSPGGNVYKIIKKWSHFRPGSHISWT